MLLWVGLDWDHEPNKIKSSNLRSMSLSGGPLSVELLHLQWSLAAHACPGPQSWEDHVYFELLLVVRSHPWPQKSSRSFICWSHVLFFKLCRTCLGHAIGAIWCYCVLLDWQKQFLGTFKSKGGRGDFDQMQVWHWVGLQSRWHHQTWPPAKGEESWSFSSAIGRIWKVRSQDDCPAPKGCHKCEPLEFSALSWAKDLTEWALKFLLFPTSENRCVDVSWDLLVLDHVKSESYRQDQAGSATSGQVATLAVPSRVLVMRSCWPSPRLLLGWPPTQRSQKISLSKCSWGRKTTTFNPKWFWVRVSL